MRLPALHDVMDEEDLAQLRQALEGQLRQTLRRKFSEVYYLLLSGKWLHRAGTTQLAGGPITRVVDSCTE